MLYGVNGFVYVCTINNKQMEKIAIKLDGTPEQFERAQNYLTFLGAKQPFKQKPFLGNYIAVDGLGVLFCPGRIDNTIYRIIEMPNVPSCDKQTTTSTNDIRSFNVSESDYSKHKIQPWDIILEYGLDFFDGTILSYLLRKKATDPRKQDYQKIIHYCQERIRQIEENEGNL